MRQRGSARVSSVPGPGMQRPPHSSDSDQPTHHAIHRIERTAIDTPEPIAQALNIDWPDLFAQDVRFERLPSLSRWNPDTRVERLRLARHWNDEDNSPGSIEVIR